MRTPVTMVFLLAALALQGCKAPSQACTGGLVAGCPVAIKVTIWNPAGARLYDRTAPVDVVSAGRYKQTKVRLDSGSVRGDLWLEPLQSARVPVGSVVARVGGAHIPERQLILEPGVPFEFQENGLTYRLALTEHANEGGWQ